MFLGLLSTCRHQKKQSTIKNIKNLSPVKSVKWLDAWRDYGINMYQLFYHTVYSLLKKGQGKEPQHLKAVFAPFVPVSFARQHLICWLQFLSRGAVSSTRQNRGSQLGFYLFLPALAAALALSLWSCEQANGTLRCDTQEGKLQIQMVDEQIGEWSRCV